MRILLTAVCTHLPHLIKQRAPEDTSIPDTTLALIAHFFYLGICPHDEVLQLNDLVIYRGSVTLFNDVVSCSPFSFFWWVWLLDTSRNLFDRHLFLSHHHWHCGQNGSIAPNKGLQRPHAAKYHQQSANIDKIMMPRANRVNKSRIKKSPQSSKKEEVHRFPMFFSWHKYGNSSIGKNIHCLPQ